MSARFGTTVASLRNVPLTAQDHSGPDTGPVEVENQFLLRLPEEPAQALREALRSGAGNVKDRLQIQLEPEKGSGNPQLRRGQVIFDGWSMSAKLMDLPTIIESMKTIDKKTFYKTADICQVLVCKEGEPSDEEEEEVVSKKAANKKADPTKVDKKYVYKHGVCASLKNCRRRRFRKTLKKKFVEAPEIEKEVKRLLRLDTEAVEIKYDLITEEELAATKAGSGGAPTAAAGSRGEESNPAITMDEKHLFGGELSDSDEDTGAGADGANAAGGRQRGKDVDIDSEGDSTMFGDALAGAASQSANPAPSAGPAEPVVTQFSSDMFPPAAQSAPEDSQVRLRPDLVAPASSQMPVPSAAETQSSSASNPTGAVALKLDSLRKEIAQLQVRKQELERNIANCDNQALLQRFKLSLEEVEMELGQKAEEEENLSMF